MTEDLKAKLERLISEASDCELIGNLASDKAKRDLFRKLATDLRAMAKDIEAITAIQAAANDQPTAAEQSRLSRRRYDLGGRG